MHVALRRAARRALATASAYVAGSHAIHRDYQSEGVLSAAPFHVIPYGVELAERSASRPPVRLPLRFGFLGSIAPHKGVHVAVEAMRDLDPAKATLHLWGDAGGFPEYAATLRAPNVRFEGRFAEEAKARVFAAMDVLLVPSIGLESFGLAAREAMQSGVPVIATADGALLEMFEAGTCGELFPSGDAEALRAIILGLLDDPTIVDRWIANLPVPKHNDRHALEIDAVYDSILGEGLR
jgi:glycosyltransferase involved in cell wall biosynthesis